MIGIQDPVKAAQDLCEILSNVADAYGIKIGFKRAKDQDRTYGEMDEGELHFELLFWCDEASFWNRLPDSVRMSDGSGEIGKEELEKCTNDFRLLMMNVYASNL